MADNFRQFDLELADAARRIPTSALVAFHKKVALEAFTRIVVRTPVDTGTLRNNWQISVSVPKGGTKGKPRKPPGAAEATAEALKALKDLPPFSVVWLTNNLPYAVPIEDGHSKRQAPQGMVGITIAELQAQL